MSVRSADFWEILFFGYLDKHDFSIERIDYKGRAMGMAARIQLVLQIDQGNLDGMRELASADAVYIAKAKSAAVFRHLSQGKWRWKARAKGRLPFGSGSLPSFL